MKIRDIVGSGKLTLSFEVFPPKTDSGFASVSRAALAIAALKPSYMSVTCGAAGNTRKNTLEVAKQLQDMAGIPAIAHLTCVGATREGVAERLQEFKAAGIENILALRGDRPKDFTGEPFPEYRYAYQLVRQIRESGDFCVGGACYPEGHPEAVSRHADLENLKAKVEAGCEFLTTQMIFDNAVFFRFLYQARAAGINVPIIPGIMPITRASQLGTSVSLSGTTIPERFRSLVDRFGDDPAAMQQAGIIYATDQIIDLIAGGIDHIHVYSMNKPEVAAGILANLKGIIEV